MTKSQSKQAFDTASSQNQGYNQNATSTYDAATGDIGDYKTALAKYAAENPYVQGGQFQTAQNQALADTAAGQSQRAAQALQAEQVRSGQNPAGAIAASERMAQQNNRDMLAAQDAATEQRLAGLTQYNSNTLNASAKPAEMESDLMRTETGAAGNALGQETEAAKTPSFWQELGQGMINAGSSFAGGYGAGMAKGGCWIAARLWGGWSDRRTILVRLWLNYPFRRTLRGSLLMLLYGMFGEFAADWLMPRSDRATRFFARLFDRALARAEEWLATTEGRKMWDRYESMLRRRRTVWGDTDGPGWHDWAIKRVGEVL